MEKAGVELVVEGLQSFIGDMGKADSSIAGMGKTTGIFGNILSGVGNIVQSVAHWISNVLAVAIGSILADAVEWAVTQFKELIVGSIEIANQFQALEIRLKQLNFNDAITAGKDFTTAMEEATVATKDELIWIQKLAFKTPFEMEDITNVYGLARAFGYTDTEARGLTETLGDFIFGMGLTGDAANSVVKQFGQMTNNGKIMQKNLNALAQGGLVPVTKLLDIMREKTGLSEKAFKKFLLTSEGVTMFKETFSKFVEENFAGAGERANRTFKNASITIKEFFQTLLAGNVVTPIIASIGETIAKTNDALQARLPDIQAAFGRIGAVISDIITTLTGNVNFDSFADGFVKGLESIASWLEGHKGDIVGFFQKGYEYIKSTVIPKLLEFKDVLLGTTNDERGTSSSGFFANMMQTLKDLTPLIQPVKDLFNSILGVAGSLFGITFGGLTEKGTADTIKGIADALSELAKWISSNQEDIAKAIKVWIEFSIVMGVVQSVISFIIGLIVSIAGIILGVVSTIMLFTSAWGALGTALTWIGGLFAALAAAITAPILAIAALAAGIIFVATMIYYHGAEMGNTLEQLGFLFKYYFGQMWKTVQKWSADTVSQINGWISQTWAQFNSWVSGIIGRFIAWKDGVIATILQTVGTTIALIAGWYGSAVSIVTTMVTAIKQKFTDMLAAIKATVGQIRAAIVSALQSALEGASSISFVNLGYNIAAGVASGIKSGAYQITLYLKKAVQDALDAAKSLLNVKSPSKVMMELGQDIDLGLAMGISQYSGLVKSAMVGMAQNMMGPISIMPQMAASAASNITTTNTNNYNLSIHSSAQTEPLISDFGMMAALSS